MQVLLLHVHKLEVPLLIVDQVNKWSLGDSATRCKHDIDILSPYKVVKVNVLENNGLFTHQADTEKH